MSEENHFVNKVLERLIHEKKRQDNEFSRVSHDISKKKEQMAERRKKMDLIRNK